MAVHASPEAFDAATLHRFTVEDLFRMVEAGVIPEGRNVELIEGVLVNLAAKNIKHERLRVFLTNWLIRTLPDIYIVAPEPGTRFSDETYLEPDIVVFDRNLDMKDLNGKTAALVIEVSQASARHDYRTKAKLYARHGVRDYWVVDVDKEVVRIHRSPEGDVFRDVSDHRFDEALSPLFLPGFSVRLTEIQP
jgi:Uma2 family endonuclease